MQIVTSLIVMISVISCASPAYIYVEPEPIDIPPIYSYIDEDTYKAVHTEPEIINEPQTVNDLLMNIRSYRNAYNVSMSYAEALEEYIDAVSKAVYDYGVENDIQD